MDPLTGEAWPMLDAWWKIDIRSESRLSDVKYVWEAARHRDLVVLARAAAIDPGGPWLSGLEGMLRTWMRQCPPELGVNWYSSLELSLRAIAWTQVLALAGARLSEDVRQAIDAQLVASGRHIMIELPYTISSMKNNHMLGDGLGLVVLGQLFPTHPRSARWKKVGDRIFLKQLSRHMCPDGSMLEDSLCYHRFVLEMLITRVLLGGAVPAVVHAMRQATAHLCEMGALEGDLPQYGDWDEGRVLTDSANAGSVKGTTLAGLAVAGRELPAKHWALHDELAWYVRQGISRDASRADELPVIRRAGNFQYVTQGDFRCWLKVSGGTSHQHADILSLWVERAGEWMIRDPGTGTYNGPIDVRNGFRVSTAHSVWHPQGVDQLGPHRAFRWLRTVRGHAATPATSDDRTLLLAWHDAFLLAPNPTRVARLVILRSDWIAVVDYLENTNGQRWEMTVPTGESSETHLWFRNGNPRTIRGRDRPFGGWHSDTYGQWRASTWLTVETQAATNVWGIGPMPTCEVNSEGVIVDGKRYSVEWLPRGISLRVTDGADEAVLEAADG